MTTQEFASWFGKLNGIIIKRIDQDKLYFYITEEKIVLKVTQVADETDNFLSIHNDNGKMVFCLHRHKFKEFKEQFTGNKKKNDICNLSFATIKEIMEELKSRKNISFAFVMYDHTIPNNILLEASGNPTFICGLLTRASQLAAKYAEENLNYQITDEGNYYDEEDKKDEDEDEFT